MMGSLKQRLERIEKAANPKGAGEPTPILTPEEVLEEARKLVQKYGTAEEFRKALTNDNNPEVQQHITEMKAKYGLG